MHDRSRIVREGAGGEGPVLHWMRREFRVDDNPGLLLARELAAERGAPLGVAVCLPADPDELPGRRQLAFLLQGLRETAERLAGLGIPLLLRTGEPWRDMAELARELDAACLVTDFDALRPGRAHLQRLCASVNMPVHEVDGRNIVPCWLASPKREYAARTIRPRIHRLLPEFLHPLPDMGPAPRPWPTDLPAPLRDTDWQAAAALAGRARDVAPADWAAGGERPGRERLRRFLSQGLAGYATRRNDPVQDATSRLSPWLHFGFVSGLRAALAAARATAPQEDKDAFLEELVVRRELSDNFCHYDPGYDSLDACADWARTTLDKHRDDPRPALYTAEELEQARTHQPLWNAAQRQLLDEGLMHGYMRMYWAKKILEWSPSPEEALRRVIVLNDRYSLDGMDSNGYTGAAWSVCGVHDRGWKERPVFGTIRYMNANGARRKFDAAEYVRRHAGVEQARNFAAKR